MTTMSPTNHRFSQSACEYNTVFQYHLFQGRVKARQRAVLLNTLSNILPNSLLTLRKRGELLKILLFGYDHFNLENNSTLFEVVQRYILDSKRFDYISY